MDRQKDTETDRKKDRQRERDREIHRVIYTWSHSRSLTVKQIQTVTFSHTYTYILLLSDVVAHMAIHTHFPMVTHIETPHSFFNGHKHTLSQSLSLAHTHTITHTVRVTHTYTV